MKNNMNYKMVKATINDVKSFYPLYIERSKWFLDNNIKMWEKELFKVIFNKDYFRNLVKNNEVYLLKNEDEILGVIAFQNRDSDYWKDDKNALYPGKLVVNTKYRGLGKLLINFMFEYAKENYYDYIRVDCYKSSKFLNDYYSNLGFKKVGTGVILGDDKILDYEYNLYEMKIK